jgi:hypothetical protein
MAGLKSGEFLVMYRPAKEASESSADPSRSPVFEAGGFAIASFPPLAEFDGAQALRAANIDSPGRQNIDPVLSNPRTRSSGGP